MHSLAHIITKSLHPRWKSLWVRLQFPVVVPFMRQPTIIHNDVLVACLQESLGHHHMGLGLDQVLTKNAQNISLPEQTKKLQVLDKWK